MSFYLLALASVMAAVIWLHSGKSALLFAAAAVITAVTLLDGLYQGVNGRYPVCFLLILAILVLAGREKE